MQTEGTSELKSIGSSEDSQSFRLDWYIPGGKSRTKASVPHPTPSLAQGLSIRQGPGRASSCGSVDEHAAIHETGQPLHDYFAEPSTCGQGGNDQCDCHQATCSAFVKFGWVLAALQRSGWAGCSGVVPRREGCVCINLRPPGKMRWQGRLFRRSKPRFLESNLRILPSSSHKTDRQRRSWHGVYSRISDAPLSRNVFELRTSPWVIPGGPRNRSKTHRRALKA